MLSTDAPSRYWLIFSSPPSHLRACKDAVFAAGAGCYGGYTDVCFETNGVSEFLPKAPLGTTCETTQVMRVEEIRVQVLCLGRDVVIEAIAGMKRAHPYKEVVYGVVKLEDL